MEDEINTFFKKIQFKSVLVALCADEYVISMEWTIVTEMSGWKLQNLLFKKVSLSKTGVIKLV